MFIRHVDAVVVLYRASLSVSPYLTWQGKLGQRVQSLTSHHQSRGEKRRTLGRDPSGTEVVERIQRTDGRSRVAIRLCERVQRVELTHTHGEESRREAG